MRKALAFRGRGRCGRPHLRSSRRHAARKRVQVVPGEPGRKSRARSPSTGSGRGSEATAFGKGDQGPSTRCTRR